MVLKNLGPKCWWKEFSKNETISIEQIRPGKINADPAVPDLKSPCHNIDRHLNYKTDYDESKIYQSPKCFTNFQ